VGGVLYPYCTCDVHLSFSGEKIFVIKKFSQLMYNFAHTNIHLIVMLLNIRVTRD
jgi:hypothetical protein